MIKIKGYKKIAVFGLGISGQSVLRSAVASEDLTVFTWDDNENAVEKAKQSVTNTQNNIVFGPIDSFPWQEIEALILSPGIPLDYPAPHRVVELARSNPRCKIICDIELLWQAEHANSLFIGISGTNGKSTTAKLIYDMLKAAGIDAQLAGNIGFPAMQCEPGKKIYILELSSFQLDLLDQMTCDCSVLLNITPNHLDRYANMNAYVHSKTRLIKQTSKSSPIIISLEGGIIGSYLDLRLIKDAINRQRVTFLYTSETLVKRATTCIEGILNIRHKGKKHYVNIRDRSQLLGEHNEENIAAAATAAMHMGVTPKTIAKTIKNFTALPHRMQHITTISNVSFINDSKATTPEATRCAMRSLRDRNVFLILGGKEKHHNSLQDIIYELKLAQAIYLIGSSTEHFHQILKLNNIIPIPVKQCYSLDTAVAAAYNDALMCDRPTVVLLSPACSSHDQWANFEERGKAFATLVRNIF